MLPGQFSKWSKKTFLFFSILSVQIRFDENAITEIICSLSKLPHFNKYFGSGWQLHPYTCFIFFRIKASNESIAIQPTS
jgi:hypothetical protein